MKYGSDEFISTLYHMGALISAPRDLVSFYAGLERGRIDEIRVVESNESGYEVYYEERGDERLEEKCKTSDDLMFFIFEKVTFKMASSHEAKHRIEGVDFRIQLFSHQLSLMKRINESWYNRLKSQLKVRIHAMERQDARKREHNGNR